MTTPTTTRVELPDGVPPAWVNALMKWALTTPGLQGMIGQGVALMSFTGRRTGKQYTIPISYHREGDVVTVITKRVHRWWHNFESPVEVELRLAGHLYTGKAEIQTDDDRLLDFMTDYLSKRPIDAKAYGLAKGEVVKDKIARIIPEIVVIRIGVIPAR